MLDVFDFVRFLKGENGNVLVNVLGDVTIEYKRADIGQQLSAA
jgi:hypothetical protein